MTTANDVLSLDVSDPSQVQIILSQACNHQWSAARLLPSHSFMISTTLEGDLPWLAVLSAHLVSRLHWLAGDHQCALASNMYGATSAGLNSGMLVSMLQLDWPEDFAQPGNAVDSWSPHPSPSEEASQHSATAANAPPPAISLSTLAAIFAVIAAVLVWFLLKAAAILN